MDALKRHWLCPWTHHSFRSSFSFLIYKIRTGVPLSSHGKDQINEVTHRCPSSRQQADNSHELLWNPGPWLPSASPVPSCSSLSPARANTTVRGRAGEGAGQPAAGMRHHLRVGSSDQDRGNRKTHLHSPRVALASCPACLRRSRVFPLVLHPAGALGSPVDSL